MLKNYFSSFLLLLLMFFVSGCVFIPDRMQLVTMNDDGSLLRVQADCIHGSNFRLIKAGISDHISLDASHISLLNWNIYKGQGENWTVDLARFIHEQDIVLLQEAVLKKDMYQPLNEHRLKWKLNTAFYFEDVEAGVLTASTIAPVRSCGLRTNEPFIRVPKTMLVSEYPLSHGGKNLLVANIHGINFTLGTQVYRQQIAALIQAVRNHDGPLIVAGDFNTWSDRRMEIVHQMVELLSLKAVTYKNHNRLTMFGNPLDHVFYRDLELVAEESLSVTSSDHNPINVVFRVPVTRPVGVKL